jgi:hypothetical protein
VDVDTLQRVREAWCALIGISQMERVRVMVSPDSPLCSKGWVGVLAVGDSVTASVPWEGLKGEVEDALWCLTADQAVSPAALLPHLRDMVEVLGPAVLLYPDDFSRQQGRTRSKRLAWTKSHPYYATQHPRTSTRAGSTTSREPFLSPERQMGRLLRHTDTYSGQTQWRTFAYSRAHSTAEWVTVKESPPPQFSELWMTVYCRSGEQGQANRRLLQCGSGW